LLSPLLRKNICVFAFLFTGFATMEVEEKTEDAPQAPPDEPIRFRSEPFRSPETGI
jgi:hypothetical protein